MGAVTIEGAKNTERFLNNLEKRVKFAALNVVAKEMRQTRKRVIQEIASQVNLNEKYITSPGRLQLKLPTPNNIVSEIKARKRGTTLQQYGAKQDKGGVSVAVKRGGSRKKIRKSFFMKLRNGNGTGVFVRLASGLKHLYGPSVSQVLRTVKDDVGIPLAPILQKKLLEAIGKIK